MKNKRDMGRVSGQENIERECTFGTGKGKKKDRAGDKKGDEVPAKPKRQNINETATERKKTMGGKGSWRQGDSLF